jgi:hypothetical protein
LWTGRVNNYGILLTVDKVPLQSFSLGAVQLARKTVSNLDHTLHECVEDKGTADSATKALLVLELLVESKSAHDEVEEIINTNIIGYTYRTL